MFLKTQLTFLGVFFLIAVLNVVSLSVLAYYISEETMHTIFTMWGTAFTEGVPSPAFTVLELQEQLIATREYYIFIVSVLNVLGILILGFFASKIGLEPTRDAISSQRNFIGHTAHELRTPLSIARANIEATLLTKETASKDELIHELQQTLTEIDGLAGIINNLVMLNTLTNLEPFEYHHHDFNEIIGEVVTSYDEFIERKNINLTVESTPDLFVWSNRNALKQMIGNVVGNAINFTPENGSITLKAFRLSSRYTRLQVIDTGVGIAKEDLPFIFKPFFRAGTNQSIHESGSGLGLSIVRELVRLHLGRIGIRSTLNAGTTVTIDLPTLRRRTRITRKDHTTEQQNRVSFNFSREKSLDDY